VKIAVFSDIHFHPFPAFAKVESDGLNSRLKMTAARAKDIVRIAKAEGCAAILFAGDLFHTKSIGAETIDEAVRAFSGADIPIIGVPGNHDMATDGGNTRHSARALGGKIRWLDNFEGRTAEITQGNEDLIVYGIPYVAKQEELRKEMQAAPKCDILLMHAGFSGSFMGSDYIADMGDCIDYASILETKAKLVVSGHFHQPQLITIDENLDIDNKRPSGDAQRGPYVPGRSILVPGSPEQHNWGDAGSHHGFWIVDTLQKMAEFHKLGSPEFVKIVDGPNTVVPKSGDYVQVSGKPDAEFIESLKQTTPHVIVEHTLAPAARPVRAFDAGIADAPKTLVQKFVETSETPLDKKRLVEAGLKYLGCD